MINKTHSKERETFNKIKKLAQQLADSGCIILINDQKKMIFEHILGDKNRSLMRVEAMISPKVDVGSFVQCFDVKRNLN